MASSTLESSSGNMNEGASDNNPADLNNENNQSSSINDANRGCTCRKSSCVMFYCKCFNSGKFCNDSCSCKNCMNSEANKDGVEEIKKHIQWRNPDAFDSKTGERNRNGCHCSKAECFNKYCGCFRNGVACTLNCLCHGCKNIYGIKGSSSGAKKQEPVQDSNSGSTNVELETMDNESSSQSPHANSSTQLSENSDDGVDDEMGNSNVNDIHMPMPSDQVASPDYDFAVHQDHVDAPYYDLPLTLVQIQSSRNDFTEQQSTDLFGDSNWQEQSSFLSSPSVYYDDNVAELSSIPRIQSIQKYQPDESHGFDQEVEASLGAMTLQHPFLRSSQQPNNGDATNMQLYLHPHLHGHGPSPPPTADYEENYFIEE